MDDQVNKQVKLWEVSEKFIKKFDEWYNDPQNVGYDIEPYEIYTFINIIKKIING